MCTNRRVVSLSLVLLMGLGGEARANQAHGKSWRRHLARAATLVVAASLLGSAVHAAPGLEKLPPIPKMTKPASEWASVRLGPPPQVSPVELATIFKKAPRALQRKGTYQVRSAPTVLDYHRQRDSAGNFTNLFSGHLTVRYLPSQLVAMLRYSVNFGLHYTVVAAEGSQAVLLAKNATTDQPAGLITIKYATSNAPTYVVHIDRYKTSGESFSLGLWSLEVDLESRSIPTPASTRLPFGSI